MKFTDSDRKTISNLLTNLEINCAGDHDLFLAAIEPELCRYGDDFQQALEWPTPGLDRDELVTAAKHFKRFSDSLAQLGDVGNEALVRALLSSTCEPWQYNDGQEDTLGIHAIASRVNWQRGDLGPAMKMIQRSLALAADECRGLGRGQSSKDRAKAIFGGHIVDVICCAYRDVLGRAPVTTTSTKTTFVSLLEETFKITTGGATIEGKRYLLRWLDANRP